jgi:hypothetical protein
LQRLTQALEVKGVFKNMSGRGPGRRQIVTCIVGGRPIITLGDHALKAVTDRDGLDWDDRKSAADTFLPAALE